MRSHTYLFASALLLSYTSVSSGACQNPVVSACSDKAAELADGLAKAAAQRGKTPEEMTDQFMSACEGQLQSDLDQAADALAVITADGGVQ